MKTTRTNRHANAFFEPLESRQMMSAGDLDPTFGVAGKIISERFGFAVADMAIQRDGKIVAVGSLNGDFAVARLNANGTLDRPFGGGDGTGLANFGGDRGDFAKSVAIQSDGKIVVGGEMDDTSFTTLADTGGFAIARFTTDGSLDKTFDGDGKLTIDMPGVEASFVSAVAIQPDGKILAAGRAGTRGRFAIPSSDEQDFAIARLMPNGRLDNTFGTGVGNVRTGKLTIGFGNDDDEGALAISLAPNGKIVVGGVGGSGASHYAVARLNSNGTLDSSFGDGISGTGRFNNLLLGNNFKDMHVAADGSVTIVGGINGNFLTVRLTSAGRLDQSFGNRGRVISDLGANDDAKHTFVSREGILVAGGSSGKFAMVRYNLNGQLDQSFGNRGQVITPVGAEDAILTTVQAPNGRLLAYGRSGSVARYFAVQPIVEVKNLLNDQVTEGSIQPAAFLIQRDAAYDFPTKVFLDITSPAIEGVDYTSPALRRLPDFKILPGKSTSGKQDSVQLQGSRPYVEIPAGQDFVVAEIFAKTDNQLEGHEAVRWAPISDVNYQLGSGNAGHVTIHDATTVRVNFQPVVSDASAPGFQPDTGSTFAARGNGLSFGWNADNTANARRREVGGVDFSRNTFNHMQKPGGGSTWEIAVPRGMYQVKLAAGDPEKFDSVYQMSLEGQLAMSATPSNEVRVFERTVNVQVNDGRLTLSNAIGAQNNKIAFIEIKPVVPGARPITANVPVNLLPVKPVKLAALPTNSRIFSQIGI